jgi:hypothetical protein
MPCSGKAVPTDAPDPPETAAAALERARSHARRAVGEAIQAARALLDAASLGWSGRPSEAHAALRDLANLLDRQAARFRDGEGAVPASVLEAALEALDQEIARWEGRATSDPEARAVLRTFLGLREILWEFGLRRDAAAPVEGPPRPTRTRGGRGAAARKAPPSPRGRVQRIDVKG